MSKLHSRGAGIQGLRTLTAYLLLTANIDLEVMKD